MKKITHSVLFVVFLFGAAIPLTAQDLKKDIDDLTRKFQEAYNKGDHKTLASFFTSDATRVSDGTATTGADQIGSSYATSFDASELRVEIKVATVTKQSDTKAISTGTYTVTGKNKKTGEKITTNGSYENEVVKDNGLWKISNMKLTTTK